MTVKVPAWLAVKVVPAGLATLGAWSTVRVKGWVASGLTPFVAVIVNGYVPPVFAAGVPASVAVPSPLSVNVTPDGSVSGAGKVHVGYPVVVTVKVPAWPTAKAAESVLVIWHAWSTVRVKLWVASGMTSFVALIVNWYVPPVFAAGVPASVAVPFLLSVNVTPDGSVSGGGKMHVGYPVVVTVKVPAWPTAKVATAVLVIWHTWSTVRVKLWIPAGLAPFVAVIVIGYVPPVFAAGVPEIVAVPSPLSVHVSPAGSAPTTDNWHGGDPVTVTVKLPNWPTIKMVLPEMVIWQARLTGRPTLVILGAAREAALVSWGAEAVSVARRSPPVGRDPSFCSVRRRAPCAIWRVAAAARTARVALCVAMDAGVPACAALATRAGRRCDASAACAWLSDPMATANMASTNTSFLWIDSVPRSSYRWCPRWGLDLRTSLACGDAPWSGQTTARADRIDLRPGGAPVSPRSRAACRSSRRDGDNRRPRCSPASGHRQDEADVRPRGVADRVLRQHPVVVRRARHHACPCSW